MIFQHPHLWHTAMLFKFGTLFNCIHPRIYIESSKDHLISLWQLTYIFCLGGMYTQFCIRAITHWFWLKTRHFLTEGSVPIDSFSSHEPRWILWRGLLLISWAEDLTWATPGHWWPDLKLPLRRRAGLRWRWPRVTVGRTWSLSVAGRLDPFWIVQQMRGCMGDGI